MPYDDYAPVMSPLDDDELDEKQKYGYAPVKLPDGTQAPSPGTAAGDIMSDTPLLSPEEQSLAKESPSGYAPITPQAPQAPQGDAEPLRPAAAHLNDLAKQGPPPIKPLHGFKKFADVLGQAYAPGLEHRLRYGAQLDYGRQLEQAEDATKAENLARPEPKPKEEKWKIDSSVIGPNGEPVMVEENSGHHKIITEGGLKRYEKPTEPKEGELPLGPRIDQLNKALTDRFQILNAGKPLPQEYSLPQNATQKDYDRIDKALEAEERARGTKAQQDAVAEMRKETRAIAGQQHNDSEVDKSYQYHSKSIDELRKPVEDRAERIARIEDTLNQNNPQADALIAPELLTVMAGGQGSGLRMNEAEIARIVGGRSAWENLKASVQHWSTDPKAARSITPEQQKEIRSLFQTAKDRVSQKMQIIRESRRELAGSENPREHRQIYQRLEDRLSAIDTGDTGGDNKEPERPAHVPANYVFKANGPKGKGWYKP